MIPCDGVEPFVASCAWTGAWLAVLLAAERRRARPGAGGARPGRGAEALVWLAKPLASAGFVAAALREGAPVSIWGHWVAAGLALSWWGDVLLIPRGAPRAFLGGMAAFGAAHVAYATGFLVRGVQPWSAAGATLVAAPLGAVALRWLWPHLDREWRRPVLAYAVVISAMLALAGATTLARGGGALLAGAALFVLSDVSVARDRFVAPGFANAAWGLPLYYAAQLTLAWAVP
jgi:uncharacterized membrane protein YhhN